MPVPRPRITPLEPPYDPEVEAMLARWMPRDSGVEPLVLLRTLGRHRDLASRSRPLAAGILARGLVEPRLRELMIHRTCALTGAEYEWGVHAVAFGAPLGFTEAQLAATVSGALDGHAWTGAELAVLRLADELHATSTVSEALFAELERHLSPEQILELCLTAGWYHAIAYVINAARIPPEPWAARFPSSPAAPV
jgi:alkylhydroperoxidase family enzyme